MTNEPSTYRLGDLPVRTTSAMVRPFLPDVEAQLRRGVALATVVTALNERGIPVTASNLAKLLHRERKSAKAKPSPVVQPSVASAPVSDAIPPADRMPIGMNPEKWAGMSERQRRDAQLDQYVNRRSRKT
jgi:hypothetical protein